MAWGSIDDEPFLSTSSFGPESPRRTGTVGSAVAHVITGLIGAGVLSIAWSVAQLGWIAGPIALLLFAATTTVSNFLLCDCYRYPHPQHGSVRAPSYMHAVGLYLGNRWEKVCGVLVYAYIYGTATAYVITAASSYRYVFVILMENK